MNLGLEMKFGIENENCLRNDTLKYTEIRWLRLSTE